MLIGFIITLREAIEVGLIVAIVLSYLEKLGRREFVKHVYYGLILGVALSAVLAVGLPRLYGPETAQALGGPASTGAFFVALFVLAFMMRRYMKMGFTPLLMIGVVASTMFLGLYGFALTNAPETLEAGALFSAVTILTYLTYWMATIAYRLKEKITSQIDLSVTRGKLLGIVTLTATAVLREGIEVSLLLYAALLLSPFDTVIGGLLGIGVAFVISYFYIAKAVKVNWRNFFLYTSILLLIFSSGILKVGIQDMVTLGAFPPVIDTVYDTSAILPDDSIIGGLLYVFIGYTQVSPLLPLLIQIVYFALALVLVGRAYHVEISRRIKR